jgi:hypothetical protein
VGRILTNRLEIVTVLSETSACPDRDMLKTSNRSLLKNARRAQLKEGPKVEGRYGPNE